MKLLFCPRCQDLFKLDYELRSCKCTFVKGKYLLDGDKAIYNGQGVMLGIGNSAFFTALTGGERGGVFLYPTDNGKITVDSGL